MRAHQGRMCQEHVLGEAKQSSLEIEFSPFLSLSIISFSEIVEDTEAPPTGQQTRKPLLKNQDTSQFSFSLVQSRLKDHEIDFDNAKVIDQGDYRVRKTLESWHTNISNKADSNSKPLPRQYVILLNQPLFILFPFAVTIIITHSICSVFFTLFAVHINSFASFLITRQRKVGSRKLILTQKVLLFCGS